MPAGTATVETAFASLFSPIPYKLMHAVHEESQCTALICVRLGHVLSVFGGVIQPKRLHGWFQYENHVNTRFQIAITI